MAIARRWSAVPEGNQTVLVMLSMRGFMYVYIYICVCDIYIYICMIYIYIYIIVSYCLYLVFEFEVYLYHCQVALSVQPCSTEIHRTLTPLASIFLAWALMCGVRFFLKK